MVCLTLFCNFIHITLGIKGKFFFIATYYIMATFEATNVLADENLTVGADNTQSHIHADTEHITLWEAQESDPTPSCNMVIQTDSININSDLSNGSSKTDIYFETNLTSADGAYFSNAWMESVIDTIPRSNLTLQDLQGSGGKGSQTVAHTSQYKMTALNDATYGVLDKVVLDAGSKGGEVQSSASLTLKSEASIGYLTYDAYSYIGLSTSDTRAGAGTTAITLHSSNLGSTNQSEINNIFETDDNFYLKNSNITQVNTESTSRDNPLGSKVYSLLQNRQNDDSGGVINSESSVTDRAFATFTADKNDPTNPDAFFNTFKIETNKDTQQTFVGASDQNGNYFEITNNNHLELSMANNDTTYIQPNYIQVVQGGSPNRNTITAESVVFANGGTIYFDDDNTGGQISSDYANGLNIAKFKTPSITVNEGIDHCYINPTYVQLSQDDSFTNTTISPNSVLFGVGGAIFFDDHYNGGNITSNNTGGINIYSNLVTFNNTAHLESGTATITSGITSGTISFDNLYPVGYSPKVVISNASITSGFVSFAITGLVLDGSNNTTGFNWAVSSNSSGVKFDWISY